MWPRVVAPAILACQFVAGQLRCIKEFCGDHLYISDLAKELFIPWLKKNAPRKSNDSLNAYGKDDCAQTDRGRMQLVNLNLNVGAARTNKIEPRLGSVNNLLSRISSDGVPAILISRTGCPTLRSGFNGQYVFEETRTHGEIMYKDTPRKNHPYSDIQDGLQYVALEFSYEIDKKKSNYRVKHNRSSWT